MRNGAQVAAGIMDRTGLAPAGDDLGVRWVAVATRRITFTWWRRWPGSTAPGRGSGMTSTGCGRRARPLRRGSGCEPPLRRIARRRGVRRGPRRNRRRGAAGRSRPGSLCAGRCRSRRPGRARAGVLRPPREAGVAVRKRYSVTSPGQVTGYAVGLPGHPAKGGGMVWFGGGKLAADLTLPKLRCRWTGSRADPVRSPAAGCLRQRPAPCSGRWSARRRTRHEKRPDSSPGCLRPVCWCGCGSATSMRARSPDTR